MPESLVSLVLCGRLCGKNLNFIRAAQNLQSIVRLKHGFGRRLKCERCEKDQGQTTAGHVIMAAWLRTVRKMFWLQKMTVEQGDHVAFSV